MVVSKDLNQVLRVIAEAISTSFSRHQQQALLLIAFVKAGETARDWQIKVKKAIQIPRNYHKDYA